MSAVATAIPQLVLVASDHRGGGASTLPTAVGNPNDDCNTTLDAQIERGIYLLEYGYYLIAQVGAQFPEHASATSERLISLARCLQTASMVGDAEQVQSLVNRIDGACGNLELLLKEVAE